MKSSNFLIAAFGSIALHMVILASVMMNGGKKPISNPQKVIEISNISYIEPIKSEPHTQANEIPSTVLNGGGVEPVKSEPIIQREETAQNPKIEPSNPIEQELPKEQEITPLVTEKTESEAPTKPKIEKQVPKKVEKKSPKKTPPTTLAENITAKKDGISKSVIASKEVEVAEDKNAQNMAVSSEDTPKESSNVEQFPSASKQTNTPSNSEDKGSNEAQVAQVSMAYLALVRRKIQAHLSYPTLAKKMHAQGESVVAFRIDENGLVKKDSLQITKSSGKIILDKSAMDAVLEAEPFLKPPILNMEIKVPVAFKLTT